MTIGEQACLGGLYSTMKALEARRVEIVYSEFGPHGQGYKDAVEQEEAAADRLHEAYQQFVAKQPKANTAVAE